MQTRNNNAGSNMDAEQFLFKDEDFENDQFQAASFVAKYRRATSLESLRTQLRLYCESLKQQLYDIINRDYKDFITIATKLEGVDYRVEHLRKPLVELRMDLTILHDTMVSNLHAISGKIQQRHEVSNRRRVLESSLACMTKLSNVEEILNMKTQNKNSANLSKLLSNNDKCSRRALIRAMSSVPSTSPEVIELGQCSELERAAVALAEAQSHLTQEKKTSRTQFSGNTVSSNLPASVVAMRRSLDQRSESIRVALLARLQLCCKVILSNRAGAVIGHNGQEEPFQLTVNRRRSLGHLLRGLIAINSGSVAEKLIAELFTQPLLKTTLTQGRVDGNQGRGSYSGLGECLTSMLQSLRIHLSDTLMFTEDLFTLSYEAHEKYWNNSTYHSDSESGSGSVPSIPIDLTVNGIWVPIYDALVKQYSGMFSSGMASVFHHCFTVIRSFIKDLYTICGPGREASITLRISTHASYKQFESSWKMDLHYQLRAQEVISRLDKALNLTTKHGMPSKVFDDIYVMVADTNNGITSSSGSSDTLKALSDDQTNPRTNILTTQQPSLSPSTASTDAVGGGNGNIPDNVKGNGGAARVPRLTQSLPVEEILQTETAYSVLVLTNQASNSSARCPITWKLDLTRVFTIELLTCLHSKVFLKELSSKLLSLLIKILNCFVSHMLVLVDVKGSTHDPTFASPMSSSEKTITPASKVTAAHTPGSHVSNANIAGSSNSMEDLLSAVIDVQQLAAWLEGTFIPLAESAILGNNTVTSIRNNTTDKDLDREKDSIVKRCLDKQVASLMKLSPMIWQKMGDSVALECRAGLKSVKSVTGKFRMTNKPPPENPSNYVVSILKPLKAFLDGLKEKLNVAPQEEAKSTSAWCLGVIESVTVTYHQQIQSVMETAQQMDTTLQRRSKLRNQASAAAVQMSDSEKIALQLLLDARAFGKQILALSTVDPMSLETFQSLMKDVEESKKIISSSN